MTDIAKRVKNIITQYINTPHISQWEYCSSSGGELIISIPETKIGVGGYNLNLYVSKDNKKTINRLTFGGIEVSAGLQLVPLPFSFSFSLYDMPSNGVIVTGPLAPKELSLADFSGVALIVQLSAQAGPGESAAAMFLGGNKYVYYGLGIGGIIVSCKAIALFKGMNANLLPFSFGASAVVGVVL